MPNHKYFDFIVHQHSRKFDTTFSFPPEGKEHLHNPIKLKNEIGPASKRDRFQFPELQSNTYSAISQYFFSAVKVIRDRFSRSNAHSNLYFYATPLNLSWRDFSRVFLLRQLWIVNYCIKISSNNLSNENI